MTKVIVGLMMAGALLVGCGSKEEGGSKGGGESIGVKECDEYFKKAEECFGKNPAVKAAMGSAMADQKKAWKEAAGTAAGKASLATSCKAANDALAASCH